MKTICFENTTVLYTGMNRTLGISVSMLVCIFSASCFSQDVSSELARFQSEPNLTLKEAGLFHITQHHPDAGPQLLALAKSTSDNDTQWLAIRGLGSLKFEPAIPFLITCLHSKEHYVRSNAARALGEIKATSATPELISLLKLETDNGVIEQTSLALQTVRANQATPVLRTRLDRISNSQTRCWLIQAVGALGSRKDVAFVAQKLNDSDEMLAFCAASALQQITGENLHIGPKEGPVSLPDRIWKAKEWWRANANRWTDDVNPSK
jgi:hypothetical protein